MINVTKTYLPNVDKYKNYVDRIFASGWLTNNGEVVKELEKRLADYLGVKNLLLVSNGTLALQIAYKLLDLKGDVITTPFSFVATTSTLVWEWLNPIFNDIDPDTLNLNPDEIKNNITKETSAIVPVHVFGNACEVEKIEQLANDFSLKVIYDAAHAFDVKYKNQSILNYGDVSTLSFHSTKVFHTIEGGALIIKDDDLYQKAKLMINFGIPGPDRISELGINCKMNEFQAAMGLCVLDDISEILKNRKKVYEVYLNNLSDKINLKLIKNNNSATLNYSYFPVIFNDETTLLNVQNKLINNDIYSRRYFYPSLETLPYYKGNSKVPNSSSIAKRILCLPIYDSLELSDQEMIIDIILKNI